MLTSDTLAGKAEGRSCGPRSDLRVFFSGNGGGVGGGIGDCTAVGVPWRWNFERDVFFVAGVILVDLRDMGVVWVSVEACGSSYEVLGYCFPGLLVCLSESGACSSERKFRVDLRGEGMVAGVLESGTWCVSCSTTLVVPREFLGAFLIGVSFATGVSAGARISSSSTTSRSEDIGLGMGGAGVEIVSVET